jgi:uncharacterized protein (TIGR03437 family)
MTGTINLDSWNLITWVRDSNGGTNNSLTGSTLYINGVEAATTSDTTLSGSAGILPTVQAGPVTIERAGDVSRYFSGTVADAAVFGKALSASVIAQQYADLTGTSAGSPSAPAITPGGVVAVDSTVTTIQPGEFVSIYGTNLGPMSPATWTGIFVTTLGGTSVTIDGNPAYLTYAGPTQINAQAPNDSNTTPHTVNVAVTTGGGTTTSTVTLAQFAPSFLLFDSKHVTGIIVRTDGSGSQGGGTYDLLGPTGNSLGFPAVAAKPGDSVQLYAVGLGPTNPFVSAGQPFSSSAPTTNQVTLLINSMTVPPSFAGIDTSLLYQINLTVPAGLGTGDVPLSAMVAGFSTQTGVVISLQ